MGIYMVRVFLVCKLQLQACRTMAKDKSRPEAKLEASESQHEADQVGKIHANTQ